MLMTTTDTIDGKNLKILGIVQGNIVQSKHIGRDFMAGLKTIVGGELRGYTELLVEARKEAANRMMEEARLLGADAIVCVRYNSGAMLDGTEVMAYGTAVKYQ